MEYDWTAGDAPAAGVWEVRVRLTSGSLRTTAPAEDPLLMKVLAAVE